MANNLVVAQISARLSTERTRRILMGRRNKAVDLGLATQISVDITIAASGSYVLPSGFSKFLYIVSDLEVNVLLGAAQVPVAGSRLVMLHGAQATVSIVNPSSTEAVSVEVYYA